MLFVGKEMVKTLIMMHCLKKQCIFVYSTVVNCEKDYKPVTKYKDTTDFEKLGIENA